MTTVVNPRHNFTFLSSVHNVYHANVGEGIPKHEHNYAHVTAVHSGRLVARKEGKEIILTKDDNPILLVANEWHELEALEDGTVFENILPHGN